MYKNILAIYGCSNDLQGHWDQICGFLHHLAFKYFPSQQCTLITKCNRKGPYVNVIHVLSVGQPDLNCYLCPSFYLFLNQTVSYIFAALKSVFMFIDE